MKLQLLCLAVFGAVARADLELLKPVLTKMAERFTTRVTAVNNLHASALVANTTNFGKWPWCCEKSKMNEVFHQNYGCVVDTNLACVRGPCTRGIKDTNRTASMPSVLGGEPACGNSVLGIEFYNACDKNTKDYEGTSWQYWGAETGLFIQFPGGGIGDHTPATHATADKYDCRKRPWYLRSKTALGGSQESSVQFSSPYFGFDAKVLMMTASRSVSSSDGKFQGVVGIDMDVTYLMEPLSDVDAAENSYSFMIDGSNEEIIAHPKITDVPKFIENGKNVIKYADVEPEEEVTTKIKEILGKDKGEFTINFARYKTFRTAIADSEEATDAKAFWAQSWVKENVEVSCTNLETTGAQIYYTICAVKSARNFQLHLITPVLIIAILAGAAFMFKDKLAGNA